MMAHRAWVGATVGVVGYIVIGLVVFSIPHPAAKVVGGAMLFPGPMYGVAAAAGAALTIGWGHGAYAFPWHDRRPKAAYDYSMLI